MKWFAIAFVLLIAAPCLAQTGAGPSTSMTPTPDDRAKQWLTLIDDRNYADAYRQMGAAARDRVSADSWSGTVDGVRAPLGAMASRNLKDVRLANALPAMRDGQYAIVRYDSAFAHRAAAAESVTLILDHGTWSVIGYFIK